VVGDRSHNHPTDSGPCNHWSVSRTDKNPDGQDDVDAIFDELVADLRAEGVGGKSEVADQPRPSREDAGERPTAPAADWRSSEVGWDETMLSDGPAAEPDDDEHFVPPEPPPLPRVTGGMLIVGLFFAIGLVLLIAPGVLGIGKVVATPLGILALAAGLGFLLLRARDDNRPPGSDPGTGAQV
jgi:hypothetical protein